MNYYMWAKKWGIPKGAIDELRHIFGLDIEGTGLPSEASSEAAVSKLVRLAYAQRGSILWRNNVGAFPDETGRWIRYGLANDSAGMNKLVKSSDLIGITPVLVTLQHVGTVIGMFTAVETKAADWTWKGTSREQAQHKFHQIVLTKGGIGRFSTGIDETVSDE